MPPLFDGLRRCDVRTHVSVLENQLKASATARDRPTRAVVRPDFSSYPVATLRNPGEFRGWDPYASLAEDGKPK
jgi:hypothetical protein